MSRKKSKKQIYAIRRLVALIIIVLIIIAILSRCSSKNKKTDENKNKTDVVVQPNTDNGEYAIPAENQTGNDQNNSSDSMIKEAISSNEEELNTKYTEQASVKYSEEQNAYIFTLKDEFKENVTTFANEENAEFSENWSEFTYNLIKSSETVAEAVKPGIEFRVADPRDEKNNLLIIKDGAMTYDALKKQS